MERRTPSALAAITLATLLAAFWTAPVLAQEAEAPAEEAPAGRSQPPQGLEEITVTAEKREALLMQTPVAVSAFSQEKMEDLNINHGTDYTTLVPGLSYRVSPNRLFIRGVGRTDNSLGLDPGVAMYTDGVYTSETAWLFASSFNMERVEVLRGPQGTLYGRNATGGAVNVIRRRPEDEFTVRSRIKFANYDTRQFGAVVTGPINERIRYSLQLSDSYANGVRDNSFHSDMGGGHSRFYEAMVEIDLTERLHFFGKWNKANWDFRPQEGSTLTPPLTNITTIGGLSFNSSFDCNPNCIEPLDPALIANPDISDAHDVNENDQTSIRLQNTWHAMGEFTYDADSFQVKYIYGFQTYDWNYFHDDIDGTARVDDNAWNVFFVPARSLFTPQGGLVPGVNHYELFIREDKQYFSHELQIASTTDSPLQWLAGYYFYNEEIEQPFTTHKPNQRNLQNTCGPTAACFSVAPFLPFFPGIFPTVTPNSLTQSQRDQDGIIYHQIGKLKSDAWAAYGEIYYDFAEDWKVTLGIRYSRDRRHAEEYQRIMVDALLYGFDYENGLVYLPGIGIPFPAWASGAALENGTFSPFIPPFGFNIAPQIDDCCAWTLSDMNARLTDSWNAWSGRLVLQWSPNQDMLAYASITQGYKAGGFRLGSMAGCPSGTFGPCTTRAVSPKFDEEDVLAYEIGFKQTLWDNRLMYDLAAFYYDYEDQQVLRSFQVPETAITHAQVINVPESEMFGAEIAIQALVNENLLVFGNYSYLNGEFTDFCSSPFEPCPLDTDFPELGAQDLRGNDTPQSPEHKFTIGLTYKWYTDWGTIALTPRYSWIDEQTYNIFNNIYADDYHRTDVTLSWVDTSNRWKIILFGKNLEDEDNFSSLGFSSASNRDPVTGVQTISGFANPPRTYGIEILLTY